MAWIEIDHLSLSFREIHLFVSFLEEFENFLQGMRGFVFLVLVRSRNGSSGGDPPPPVTGHLAWLSGLPSVGPCHAAKHCFTEVDVFRRNGS